MESDVSYAFKKELNGCEIINSCSFEHLPYYFDLVFEKLGVMWSQTFAYVEQHFGQVFLQSLICDCAFISDLQHRHRDFSNGLSSEERLEIAVVGEISMLHHQESIDRKMKNFSQRRAACSDGGDKFYNRSEFLLGEENSEVE